MNLRAAAFCAIICLLASPANAQLTTTHAGGGVPGTAYTGPGDVVSGAKVWWGLRAYNAAYATGSNPAVTVRRASDNTTQNINILSNGNLDVASANTFAGQDATASCTISSTTATCTGASSTPHVGSTITGAGVTQPCFASAVGSFAGGSGTVTVSDGGKATPCGTIGSPTTLTFQYGLYVTTIFDQSGNGNICTSSSAHCDAVQATTADQPELLPKCPTLPCLLGDGAATLLLSAAITTGSNQPFSYEAVGERIGNPGTSGMMWSLGAGTGFAFGNGANTAFMYAGGTVSNFTPANDSASHVLITVFNNTSSIGSVDNNNTTTSPGTGTISNGQGIQLMRYSTASYLTGYWMEGGLWYSGWNTTQITNACHNSFAYWGTSVSC